MRGYSKITCFTFSLLVFGACVISPEERKASLSNRPVIRSVVVVPFINYSGAKNVELDVNGIFISTLRNYRWLKVIGKKDIDNYLRKRGIKKRLTYDRITALTLGKIFRADVVIYGSILSYYDRNTESREGKSPSLSMDVRVIDTRSGRTADAYTVSGIAYPNLFRSSVEDSFTAAINDAIHNITSDLIEGR